MLEKHYKLRILPLFEEDLNSILDYIDLQLENTVAALNFADEVHDAIKERTSCAEAFEPYRSVREHKYPYYRIYVKNYVIYYVVIDEVMEVRRILYNRRNHPDHI